MFEHIAMFFLCDYCGMKKDSYSLFSIRLRTDLKEALADAARMSERSLNSELVDRLESSLRGNMFARAAAEKDPLAAAYLAANAIEEYVNAIRASILMKKVRDGEIEVNEETYPGLAAFAPDAVDTPMQMKPEEPLTTEERRLASAFKNLSPEAKLALLTLIERG